jgi:PAS domain-containing protein
MLRSLAAVASAGLVMRRDLINKTLSVRSQHEQILQRSGSHYRAIVEDLVELVSLASVDGELCYVNPSYARHFGSAPADMVGRSLFDVIQPSTGMWSGRFWWRLSEAARAS